MALLAFVMPLLRLDVFISPQTLNASGIINYMPAVNVFAAAEKYIPQNKFSKHFIGADYYFYEWCGNVVSAFYNAVNLL